MYVVCIQTRGTYREVFFGTFSTRGEAYRWAIKKITSNERFDLITLNNVIEREPVITTNTTT